jgi:hypothetical protein
MIVSRDAKLLGLARRNAADYSKDNDRDGRTRPSRANMMQMKSRSLP